MEKYIEIAKKYLVKGSKSLTKGLCFTIRKTELDNSNNVEKLIEDRLILFAMIFRKSEVIQMIMELCI